MLNKIQKQLTQWISSTEQHSSSLQENTHKLFKAESTREKNARLAVYQNNFYFSLIEILRDIYPTIYKLTGEDFFKALAREFINSSPPTSPLLYRYGLNFPEFVDNFVALKNFPYMTDVSRLDLLRHQAYYAKDAQSLGVEDFSQHELADLSEASVNFHPSTGILISSHAVYNIWESNQESSKENNAEEINASTPESVLILRSNTIVSTYKLDNATAFFLSKLGKEFSIAQALQLSLENNANFNATAAIDFLISSGICIAINCKS